MKMKNTFLLVLLFFVSLLVTVGCQQWPKSGSKSPAITRIKDKLGVNQGRDSYSTVNHPVYEVARAITRFEDQLRQDGTITVKTPDVWTDSSLMHSIQEFDGLMEESTDEFEETLQAYLAKSIREGVSSETSTGLGDIDGAEVSPPEIGTATTANITKASETLLSALNATKDLVSDDVKFKLEPTQRERQRATYINVNQSLRRKKLGGDNIRMPGYGLYLFRVPVSVLPGVETSQGYSAVVNMRARTVVTASDVKYTLPRMAIAQLVNSLARRVHTHWTDKAAAKANETEKSVSTYSVAGLKRIHVLMPQDMPQVDRQQFHESDVHSLPLEYQTSSIPPIDGGVSYSTPVVETQAGSQVNSTLPVSGATDANAKYTDADIESVYQYMSSKWGDDPPQLNELREFMFSEFLQMTIHMEKLEAFDIKVLTDRGEFDAIQCAAQYLEIGKSTADIKSQWVTGLSQSAAHFSPTYLNTAWLVARQCGLADLNIKRLIDDMVLRGRVGQQLASEASAINFLGKHDLDEATRIWNEVVANEFPLQVFTIEPTAEEQNLLDSQSRLRQLQVALATSIAGGGWNVRQRVQMAKEIARDSAAIGLNRTNVGFVHGIDTFGWYFHPRVQSPERRTGTFSTIKNAIHPETRAEDARTYRLEPGMRECEVLIAMPSFVQQVEFDVTTNWESLAKPGQTKRSYEELIGEGCHFQKLKACLQDQGCVEECREGDVARLNSRIEQLEQMLSLQTYTVEVPYDHDIPTRALFGRGEKSLTPRLYGYHGLQVLVPPQPGAKEDEIKEFTAEFFLTGRNFHPTLTHVVVGGHEVHAMGQNPDVEILSRELIRVKVKIETDKMNNDGAFEIRVGTPSGMSFPLTIDRYEEKAEENKVEEVKAKSLFDWTKVPAIDFAYVPKTNAADLKWTINTPAAKKMNPKIALGSDNPMSESQFNGSSFKLQMAYEMKFEGDENAQPVFKGSQGSPLANPHDLDYASITMQIHKDIAANVNPTETRKATVKVTSWFIVDDWPMEKMDTTFDVTVTPVKQD